MSEAAIQIKEASISLPVRGMTCVACAARIERALERVPGIVKASVSFASEAATVSFDPEVGSPADIAAAIVRAATKCPPRPSI